MKAISKRYGKAPWIKTSFAKPYKRRLALGRIMAASVAATGQYRLFQIRHDVTMLPAQKIVATAETAINTVKAINKAMSYAQSSP